MNSPTAADPTAHLRDYHYPSVYADFLRNTDKHEMTVLKEDGLYRHLRFREPGTAMYGYDVITWPGYVTLVGDIADGFTFSRETDMFGFIDHGQPAGHINVSYWAEKLVGRSRDDVKSYSEDMFKQSVLGQLEDVFYASDPEDTAEVAPLKAAAIAKAESELFPHAYYEHEAREALNGFTFTDADGTKRSFYETYEWELADYDYHFVLACHALLTAARAFRTMNTARNAAEPVLETANA